MSDRYIITGELEPFLILDKPQRLEKFYIEKIEITQNELIVYCPLHASGGLLKFRNGCTIELLRKEWSSTEEYKLEEVIIKITNCRLIRSWVDDPIRMEPDESMILLFAKISGDVEVLIDEYRRA